MNAPKRNPSKNILFNLKFSSMDVFKVIEQEGKNRLYLSCGNKQTGIVLVSV